MSLNGIPQNPLLASLAPVGRPATSQGTPAGIAPNGGAPNRATLERPAAPDRPAAARPSIASAPSTVPPEAPAGTDPALWSVLTTEERAFFAKTATLGPLTYGKIKNATLPAPPAMRGGRLDVRA
jgi:hypothetical protein